MKGRKSLAVVLLALRGSALASKLLLSIFVARFIGLEEAAYYGYTSGAAAIFPVALGLGIMQELSRQIVTDGIPSIANRLFVYWRFLLAVYLIITLTLAAFAAIYTSAANQVMIPIIGAILLVEHLNNDAYFIISSQKKPIFANFQVFMRAAAWIFVYIPLALIFTSLRTIHYLFLFWLGGIILSFLLFAIKTQVALKWKSALSHNETRSFLPKARSTKTIFIGEIINATGAYLDRYLIGIYLGHSVAGIYSIISSIGIGIYTLVNTSTMQVHRPFLIEHHANRDRQAYLSTYSRCLRSSLIYTAALSVIAVVLYQLLLPALGLEELASYRSVLWIYLFGILIRVASDMQGYVFYTQRLDFLFSTTAAIAPISLGILSVFGVGFFGLPGGAGAFGLAFFLSYLARSHIIHKHSYLA